MGLFGPSKKEKALWNLIDELKSKNEAYQAQIDDMSQYITPELRDYQNLQKAISKSKAEIDSLDNIISCRNTEINNLHNNIHDLKVSIDEHQKLLYATKFDVDMQEYGVYKPSYEFASSDLYQNKLNQIRDEQKQLIKNNLACTGNTNWTVSGSAAKGKAMVKDMQKLLLRAFNVECDDVIDNITIANFEKSISRIEKSREQISKLGHIMDISINYNYMMLKMDELRLALDYQQKKQEEREIIKELKAQQREEAKAQKEIEEERKRLKKEQAHYQNALKQILDQIKKNGGTPELEERKAQLEEQLDDTEKAIVDVDYREANKRAGYVYIISNIGAFGENVYKIGMTRRLDPTERVDELGDASVPFDFDIHALIFSEDAPSLETALHNAFESKKLNKINHRREFFHVTLDEIKAEVRKNHDKTVEWIDIPQAEQYRQSIVYDEME